MRLTPPVALLTAKLAFVWGGRSAYNPQKVDHLMTREFKERKVPMHSDSPNHTRRFRCQATPRFWRYEELQWASTLSALLVGALGTADTQCSFGLACSTAASEIAAAPLTPPTGAALRTLTLSVRKHTQQVQLVAGSFFCVLALAVVPVCLSRLPAFGCLLYLYPLARRGLMPSPWLLLACVCSVLVIHLGELHNKSLEQAGRQRKAAERKPTLDQKAALAQAAREQGE